MKVVDISTRFLKEDYSNDINKLIVDIKKYDAQGIRFTTTITNNNIINAFGKDFTTALNRFKRFMLDNINIYSIFYDLENDKILTVNDIKKGNF